MGGMLISSNLKGWRYFFSSGLGWSVISSNLKEGNCTFIYIYIINSQKKKKKTGLSLLSFNKYAHMCCGSMVCFPLIWLELCYISYN